jgi:hypothetical protein
MTETDLQYFKRVVYFNTDYSDEEIQSRIEAQNKFEQERKEFLKHIKFRIKK